MDKLKSKKVSDSRTEQIQILMPEHINGFNRLFGGKLMEWIDVVAAVVARRHSGCNVTTASIDNLQFKAPAYVNSTIFLLGQITYVGKTSMEVRVDTFVEELNGIRRMINSAHLVLVALDENDKPVPVPGIFFQTQKDKIQGQPAKTLCQFTKQRRREDF